MSADFTPKKYKSCARCRMGKLKCIYDPQQNPPITCDRCRQKKLACVFDEKFDERKAINAIDQRVDKLENSITLMVNLIKQATEPKPHRQPESSNSSPTNIMFQSPASPSTARSEDSPVAGQDVLNMRRGTSYLPSIKYILNSRDVDIDPTSRSENSAFPGTATGMLSEIVPTYDKQPNKRRKTITHGQITRSDIEQLLVFFTEKLARYLPVLVFHQIPKLDISLQHTSPLLFSSILAVASLYDRSMIDKHELFLSQFEAIVRGIDPNIISLNADFKRIYEVLQDCLGLIIGGAWLGTEFGFRMSLMASDMIGRLLPDSEADFNLPPELKPLFCSLGTGTYIIEQRLRIIHDRPVPPMYKGAEYRTRRDMYLSMFLRDTLSNKDVAPIAPDPTQLKATANVELCSVMMMYQQQMNLNGQLPYEELMSWNAHLNGWLAEWIGKLTAHVKLSSWKPVILSFHFAKLFLNVRVLEHHEPIPEKEVIDVFTLAKGSAIDILEMLFDEDIKRLVSVSPVFYPTIFVTASAFLLKLLHVSVTLGYQLDRSYILTLIRDTHRTLREKIDFEESPCYSTIENLEDCLRKVESEEICAKREPSGFTPVEGSKNLQEQHPTQSIEDANQYFDVWKFDINDPYFMTDAHSNILFQSVFNSK